MGQEISDFDSIGHILEYSEFMYMQNCDRIMYLNVPIGLFDPKNISIATKTMFLCK